MFISLWRSAPRVSAHLHEDGLLVSLMREPRYSYITKNPQQHQSIDPRFTLARLTNTAALNSVIWVLMGFASW